MKKVRYMTVSRVAVELVSKLSTDEKGKFIDFLNSAFKQMEKGEPVTVPETDGVMAIAIEETVTELTTGYKNYLQKMTAVEKAQEKKRLKELKEMGVEPDEIGDTSANSRRTIGDTSASDIRLDKKDKTLPDKREKTGRDTGNPVLKHIPDNPGQFQLYLHQLNAWLNLLGVKRGENDPDILNAWNDNGIDAIRTAFDQLKDSKDPVTKETFISAVYQAGQQTD